MTRTRPTCTAPDCTEPNHAKGLCKHHYQVFKYHGTLDVSPRKRKSNLGITRLVGDRWIDNNGYELTKTEDGIRHVHRIVMEQHLGRTLLKGENVHHRNGQRADNRLENLELWVTYQPTGQRVEDLLEFVINHYGVLLAERLSSA